MTYEREHNWEVLQVTFLKKSNVFWPAWVDSLYKWLQDISVCWQEKIDWVWVASFIASHRETGKRQGWGCSLTKYN